MSLAHPGFADPVQEAQQAFRTILDAMSHPGKVVTVGEGLNPPSAIGRASAATLLTLVDADTPLWIDDLDEASQEWIRFHCGATFTLHCSEARFAYSRGLPDFSKFNAGSDEEPEESATLVLEIAGFGYGARMQLSGPGLRETAILNAAGLPPDFVTSWAVNHRLFPRGVDLLLCFGSSLAALPRSVRIEEG